MNTSRKRVGRAIGASLAVLLAAGSSVLVLDGRAGGTPKAVPAAAPAFQYVAKFVCVNEVGPASTAVVNQAGPTPISYRTVVNVHNPNTKDVTIGKKAAGAASENSGAIGKIGKVKQLVLVPDQVLMIDCKDISLLLGGIQPNGDGVVVVYSNQPLDIWAVYTMRGILTPTGGGSPTAINGNIDVVHVEPSTFS